MKRVIDKLEDDEVVIKRVRFPDHDCSRIQIAMRDGRMNHHVPNAINEAIDGHWHFCGVYKNNGTQWVEFER